MAKKEMILIKIMMRKRKKSMS